MLFAVSKATDAAVIFVGGFPELNPSPSISIPADTFLVPVQISGAVNLQNWQFDLLFDNTVVEEVDPLDGSSGIYGAEFTPGDPDSVSFIFAGIAFNALGLVDDVAGSNPLLLNGPSGDGVLAYILSSCFNSSMDRTNNDPNFTIGDTAVQQQAPEPTTLALLAAVGLTFPCTRRFLRRIRLPNEH